MGHGCKAVSCCACANTRVPARRIRRGRLASPKHSDVSTTQAAQKANANVPAHFCWSLDDQNSTNLLESM